MDRVKPMHITPFATISEEEEIVPLPTEQETISVDERSCNIEQQTTSIDEASFIEYTTSVSIKSNMAVSSGEMALTVEQITKDNTVPLYEITLPANEEVIITIEKDAKDEKVPNDMAAPANIEFPITIDDMGLLANQEVIITIQNATVPEAHCRMPIPSEHSAPKAGLLEPLDIEVIKEREKRAKKGQLLWALTALCFMIAFIAAFTSSMVH
ncbi:hypothetical protein BO78DRAFT_441549 [Aspergillus sclerotiicarbonarius CBS 121057]|uniref:Uncharacterized protein n=1 Tax=Aspergillus sclerotiicarbonarius (strain CBS 121057 / IBT 28362) TaxID=1448318 RepID=A0A319FKA0_ASPSB|nr:hypothetical protein BO78DRAFT_441549 [Aspergillus sclerotiicarbonarius CBS 121057]